MTPHQRFEANIPRAKVYARSAVKQFGHLFNVQHLYALALQGLWRAAQGHKSEVGGWNQYSWQHMRGAVQDEARTYCWGSRGTRPMRVVHMSPEVLDCLQSPPEEPESDSEPQLARLQDALEILSPRHRWVLEQYYLKNRTQLDIAVELGVSEVRIHQIRNIALRKLRGEIGAP